MSQYSLVVLAAGLGSRYGGLKQLDPVGPSGETILEYSVFDAVRAGVSSVVFVIREEMQDAFESELVPRFQGAVDVRFAVQEQGDIPGGFEVPEERAKPWGTGHAVLAARHAVDGPFAVVNADDFYGADAFAKTVEFFRRDEGAARYAMAGYVLRNTLSDHGSVARGICRTDETGSLISVEELTRIERDGDGARNTGAAGQVRQLSGDELTSMNFWALRPAAFGQFWSAFEQFLANPSNRGTGEFYIPTAIGWAMQNDGATVKVLRTGSRWFGVTYRDDRPAVVAALQGLIESGEYPRRLWG